MDDGSGVMVATLLRDEGSLVTREVASTEGKESIGMDRPRVAISKVFTNWLISTALIPFPALLMSGVAGVSSQSPSSLGRFEKMSEREGRLAAADTFDSRPEIDEVETGTELLAGCEGAFFLEFLSHSFTPGSVIGSFIPEMLLIC